ncbi:primary-amine oxidase [Brevibacillus ginsengisoli]|uniref:copper amine oxidase n=1 Tax=Brevibacillus ginsengisoli TaxID=363854 RepID=UPI003CF08E93
MKKPLALPLIVTAAALTGTVLVPYVNSPQAMAHGVEQKQIVRHPLDPLTADEMIAVNQILKDKGYASPDLRFYELRLEEPDKADVWKWKPGMKFTRKASFVVMKGRQVFEGVVDLGQKSVTSWTEIKVGQPLFTAEEYAVATDLIMKSAEVKKALARRGITDMSKVVTDGTGSVGYFGRPEEDPTKRLAKATTFLNTGDGNIYAHPIEGLIITMDLVEKKILKVEDTGDVPVSKADASYGNGDHGKTRPPLKPLTVSQPKGANYKIDGHVVTWQNWKFHYRLDPRVGPIISTVTYNDHGTERKIMYSGCLGGMTVPYGDPSAGWYYRAWMDSGDYGMALFSRPLEPGTDAPPYATYLNELIYDYMGKPVVSSNVMALYERDASPEYSHWDAFISGKTESRERRELVMRFVSTVGNYDYFFDWVFEQDGNIRVNVGASGLEAVKGVHTENMAHVHDEKEVRNGTLLDEHILGVNHQHLYNFRLDLDVDGMNNSVVEWKPKAEPLTDNSSPRKSEMVVKAKTYEKEQDAIQKWDPDKIVLVTNPSKNNKQGYPTGYQVIANAGTSHPFAQDPLFTDDDWPLQRMQYATKHIWVTPYQKNELYPEGKYVNQNTGETGLGLWTKQNRPIVNTDDVVWLTTGTTHITRAEEWPMMPTEWASILLKPFNFFDRTPTLDLPKPSPDKKPTSH